MIVNVANVINMLAGTFQIAGIAQSPVTPRERELHDEIYDILVNSGNSEISIEHNYILDFIDHAEPHEAQFVEYTTPSGEEEDNYESDTCVEDDEGVKVDLQYKRKAVDYWKSGKKKLLTLSTVQNRFKKVRSVSQLYRWEESINRGGSNIDKLAFITEYVLTEFEKATDKRLIIHDVNLRKWALEAKSLIDLPSFKASVWWIWKFKKVHGIVSRKITTFKTRSSYRQRVDLEEIAKSFVATVKPDISIFGKGAVFNADESEFNLEVHSGRTLANIGVKTVEAVVQSVSATTHSYTIMPIVSAEGQLISPLYIVLKEPTGTFGPRIQETLFRPSNVYIQASKSGKLTSLLFKNWFQEVYLQNTGPRSLLLIDSWTGHCPATLQEIVPQDKEVKILSIPKKTTSIIQPLDVYGFRIWKNFVRTFSDNVLLQDVDINLHSRNNIIKLQSLVHNQFSSPRFQNLFKYSWYKSGYVETHPSKFENPVDFCFFRDASTVHRCSMCDKIAFMRCAWCGKYFCFEHFYERYHTCSDYRP